MNEALPGCRIDTMRDFLKSLGMDIDEMFSDSDHEVWTDKDHVKMVRIPLQEDPMYFQNVVAIVEMQLKMYLHDIPYYKKIIEDRYSPEGQGNS